MGNLLSSGGDAQTLRADNAKLEEQIESLKDLNTVSTETIRKLRGEIASQRKKVDVLKKAGRELVADDTICANTKRELEAVIDENDNLVAEMKAIRAKHSERVREITAAKNKIVKKLKAKLANTSANERLVSSLKGKLLPGQ
jgi:small-conductance mechanosensitive channel